LFTVSIDKEGNCYRPKIVQWYYLFKVQCVPNQVNDLAWFLLIDR